MSYRGRFAPSPTGPLHFGSLVTAAASYIEARARGGEWLVRIEDVDVPRSVPGADADILRTLEAFGFEWDGPVVYQSTRTEAYREAFEELRRGDLIYACSCSRKEAGSCTCRGGIRDASRPLAWRARFDDFVVLRSDGYFAYQLAVVVDDEWQRITDVVRGADLLDSTPWQIWLQDALGYRRLRYRHVPVIVNKDGEKLSKQTGAPPLDLSRAPELLYEAVKLTGQNFQHLGATDPREFSLELAVRAYLDGDVEDDGKIA
jgi:glutamyl-Q tRNA(Asp) synthetase